MSASRGYALAEGMIFSRSVWLGAWMLTARVALMSALDSLGSVFGTPVVQVEKAQVRLS